MLPFLNISNKVLEERGVKLPLEDRATTTLSDRLEKGAELQAEILRHRGMREAWEKRKHQPLAGLQLFRRLLHPQRTHSG